MLPDASPDFLHADFQYENEQYGERRQEDRRQEIRIAVNEPTAVSLQDHTLKVCALLTDVSVCGFQVQHQTQYSLSTTFTLCRGEDSVVVRTIWEHHDKDDVRIGLLREEVYLIHRLRNGDPEALWHLMSPHMEVLRKFAFSILHNHEDTEDALQEVMVKVLIHCSQFHPGRSFRAWVMQITRNEALKLLRGVRRRNGLVVVSPEDDISNVDPVRWLYSPAVSPADMALQNELKRAIQNEVATLETKYRQVFLLRHWLQLDMPELAQRLNITVDAAHTRLHRAHEAIRGRLGTVFGPAPRTRGAAG